VTKLPEFKREILQRLHEKDTALTARKVLIVDDDIRNIFGRDDCWSVTRLQILSAENGKTALELLRANPDIGRGPDGHHDAGNGRLRYYRAIRKLAKFPHLAHSLR